MKITFFNEDISFKIKTPNKLRSWIEAVINHESKTLQNINYIFCSDEYLHTMNKQYLSHDTYTDIITFDNSDIPGLIEGDIFISIDRVKENASLLNTAFDQELNRVMVHGVLHLCGHTDKTKTDKEAMRKKEDACLSLLSGR